MSYFDREVRVTCVGIYHLKDCEYIFLVFIFYTQTNSWIKSAFILMLKFKPRGGGFMPENLIKVKEKKKKLSKLILSIIFF